MENQKTSVVLDNHSGVSLAAMEVLAVCRMGCLLWGFIGFPVLNNM